MDRKTERFQNQRPQLFRRITCEEIFKCPPCGSAVETSEGAEIESQTGRQVQDDKGLNGSLSEEDPQAEQAGRDLPRVQAGQQAEQRIDASQQAQEEPEAFAGQSAPEMDYEQLAESSPEVPDPCKCPPSRSAGRFRARR